MLQINRYGHVSFPVRHINLTGEEEIARTQWNGRALTDRAGLLFRCEAYASEGTLDEREYRVVLIQKKEIHPGNEYTVFLKDALSFAIRFGYNPLPARLTPRIGETVSISALNEKLRSMSRRCVFGTHTPIRICQNDSCVLAINYRDEKVEVMAPRHSLSPSHWPVRNDACFAFLAE